MLSTAKKAFVAAAVGFAGAVGTALTDGSLSAAELGIALGVGLAAGVAVYKATNTP